MGLTRLAIARPVFFFMLMALTVLFGTMAYRSLRVEQNPEVTFGVISIATSYPGAGPEEVNELVSRRIEDVISGVNGLREVTSTATEGVSVVIASFELGTEMNVAQNDVRGKVDGIIAELPDGVRRPTIEKFDAGSDPVLYLAVNSDRLSNLELRELANRTLTDRFSRIGGVGQVVVSGGDEREIQVRVKRDRLLALGIGITDVLNAVRSATVNLPSGRIVAGAEEYGVRVLGEFRNVDDIRSMSLIVRDPNDPNARDKTVPITSVADVVDAAKERLTMSRLDGREAVLVVIQKARDGNAVEIAQTAKGVIERAEADFGLKFQTIFNSAENISNSLEDVQLAVIFGIILVTAIVWLFLHDWRGTLIVATAIPLCIFAAMIAVKAFGFTLNNLTMLGIALSVGVLVDDAIVVLENIYRHLRMGEPPAEAAINGRSEIGLAAISITLADVVVFLPIAAMGGIVGQFYRPLALTFVAAVVVSLLVSFTVTPMLAARWYKQGEDVEANLGPFARGFERAYGAFEGVYRRALRWCLDHRWFVFLIGNLALFAVIFFIGGSFMGGAAAAVQFGMIGFFACVVVALVVFVGHLVVGAAKTPQAKRGMLAIVVASFVVAFALKASLGERLAMPAHLLGIVLALLLVGLCALFLNLRGGVSKLRLIVAGAAFGLIFPAAAIAGALFAGWKKEAVFKFTFVPPFDGGSVSIKVELPPGSSLEQTRAVVERLEVIARRHPDVKYTNSTLGVQGGGGFGSIASRGSQYAGIQATLNPKVSPIDVVANPHKGEKMRRKSDVTVAAELTEMVGRVAGASVTVAAGDQFGFGTPIQISLRSEDRQLLLETASDLRARLAQGAIKGVVNPEISSKPGKPEVRAIPDRARLADLGLSVGDVAAAMRVLYEGNDDTKLRVRGEEFPIRVMMDLADRNDPRTIELLPLRFNQGRPVYLTSVARVEPGTTIDKIERRDRTEEIRLTANLLPGYVSGSTQAEINQWIDREKLLPQGVERRDLGQADAQARESVYLFQALFLGLILVYMLLASLYNNMLYPFIIQLAQPQAMVGALLALMLTDKPLNIIGFIGIIALVGLVGKNAILLVDYTNTLRTRGRERRDALLEAAPTRLRPIVMTSLALILGMLPVALAIGRGSEFRETIGIIIIGGIALSTFLTLLVIPASYTIFDDLYERFRTWRDHGRGSSPGTGAEGTIGIPAAH